MKKFLAILLLLTTLITQGWGDTEPNDSCAQAETWATLTARGQSSSTMTGSVASSDQNDYYKIVLSTSGSLQVTGSSNQNTSYYILNSACNSVANQTNTRTPNLSYTAAAGTYYLRINRNNSSTYSNMKATLGYIDAERSFASIYSSNTRGGVKIIGNSNLCLLSGGVCVAPAANSNNDSGSNLGYWNIASNGSTFNSTTADVALNSGSKIVFAGLYWQGYVNMRDKSKINQIKFKKPGGTYQTLTATRVDTLNTGRNYQSFVDVTNQIDVNNPNGTYAVADIMADIYADANDAGVDNYAAWAMFIVYENPGESLKNITLWDGYDSISSGSTTITASGFRTPSSTPINSSFLIFSTEGDVQTDGDYIKIDGTLLKDALNLAPNQNNSNVFNSTISSFGSNVTNRSPNYQNTLGIDVDEFNVSSILGTNQTSASIVIGSSGDAFYVSAFAFSTEIYSPAIGNFDKNVSITYASNQTCGTGKDLRGATLNYEMSFQNTGTEHAETVRVYDDFQSNGILDYLDMTQTTTPVAQLISGTASPSVSCDKNATSVYCDFSKINKDTKYKITFATKVKSTIILTDDIDLNNTANAHYYNAATHEEITQLASSNMQVAGGICALLPLANYRFDKCLWNGTANEILDSTGNGYTASIFNTGASTEDRSIASGGICRVSKLGGNAYLQIDSSFPNLTSDFSITGWFNSSNITKTGQRIFIDDQSNSRGYGLSVNDDGNRYVRFYDRSQSGNGIIDATAAPLSSNQWYFAAAVTDVTQSTRHLYVYDNSGTLLDHKTAAISGAIGTDSGPASMGGETNSGETANRFQGYQDEIKVFAQALTQTQVAQIALNEANQLNFDGTTRTCNTCSIIPDPAVTFDAWDTFRSISDRNISTKIVSKAFDLNISSLNETNDGYQDFNGTLCARLIDTAGVSLTDWVKLTYASEQTKTATFTLSRAIGGSDSAGVRLMWEKNAPSATACDALTNTETIIASDRFSVRPLTFTLPSASGIAGVDFNITFTAPNFTGTASTAYNESAGGSFDVSVAEHNPLCTLGTFNPIPNSFSFVNGTKLFTTRYSEVGVLDVNITDLTKACNARYANVDCDDADVSGFYTSASDLPIGLTQGQITVKAHHFDVTGTLTNFSGGNFTYLSDDLNMSAALDLNITAKNGEGNTTANYSSACYAKNTDLTLVHSTIPSPLTKILYSETLSALNTNVLNTDPWVLSLNSGLFNSGSVIPNIDFNFDRSPSKPLNPFDFNITSATATDADAVSGTGTPLGDATFVYGRARAFDVTTNETSAPNPIEFEVYSTTSSGFVSGMPQNVLKWYRNLNHDSAAEGNVIRGGYSAGEDDIDASATPTDGLQIVTVTSVHDQTIHLDISKWLWYSPNYTYDYSGNCTRHPCFNYDYTDASLGVKGVNSGTFQGSDFQMTPAKNITNKGVKLFR